jgi:hypothetical protein
MAAIPEPQLGFELGVADALTRLRHRSRWERTGHGGGMYGLEEPMDEVSSSGGSMGSPSSDPSFELRPLRLDVLSGLVETTMSTPSV